ncbi:MAG TPA: F0F1 ATP synthase subunit delta [Gammaproteobacteria bacterium]
MADHGTVARPYARALFEIAQGEGKLAEWSAALAAAAAVVRDPVAKAYLGQPGLTNEERANFVASIAGQVPEGRLLESGHGKNLLLLLAENRRLKVLPEISAQFDALKAQAENKLRVTMVTAVPVDGAVTEKIAEALRAKLGRLVEIEQEVDPSLLGGAVIRAEDMVIDGSVRSRLQRLAESLTH